MLWSPLRRREGMPYIGVGPKCPKCGRDMGYYWGSSVIDGVKMVHECPYFRCFCGYVEKTSTDE